MRVLVADRMLAAGLLAVALFGGNGAVAQEPRQSWQVGKATGDVWVVSSGVQNASLTSDTALKSGDSIRTGRTGRVFLKRGEETIMIAPNSVVGIPAETKPGSTTIVQQAGSILLEVNKRDARTFEVETPYLVAAVKGTQFRVTVGAKTSDVVVQHGSVEVSDSKTGKFALVLPGQSATVSALAGGGLSLRGQGTLSPIQNGTPRATSIDRVPVPRGGLTAPSSLRAGLQARPLAAAGVRANAAPSGLRISAPIGQVRLDVHAATKGLAGDVTAPGTARRAATIWSSNGASNAAASNSFATVSPTVVTGVGAGVTPPAGHASGPGGPIGSPTLGSTVAPIPVPAGGGAGGGTATASGSGSAATVGTSGLGTIGLGTIGLGTSGVGTTGLGTIGNGIVTVITNEGGNGKGNNGNGNGNGGGNGSNAGGNGNGNGNSGQGNSNNSGNGNVGLGNVVVTVNGNGNGNSGNGNGNGGGNGSNAGGNGNGNSGSGNNGNGNGNGGGNGSNGLGNAFGRTR